MFSFIYEMFNLSINYVFGKPTNKSLFDVFKFIKGDTIYQPLRSGRIWHKVNF